MPASRQEVSAAIRWDHFGEQQPVLPNDLRLIIGSSSSQKPLNEIPRPALYAQVGSLRPGMLVGGYNVARGRRQTLRPPNRPGVEDDGSFGPIIDHCRVRAVFRMFGQHGTLGENLQAGQFARGRTVPFPPDESTHGETLLATPLVTLIFV